MKATELAAEADAAAVAFQLALARIGAETLAEALALWARIRPTQVRATAEEWLAEAIQLILTRRMQTRDLAIAYYRLARALRTGSTVPDPHRPEPQYVTLAMLRNEFRLLIEDYVDPEEMVPDSDPHPGGEDFDIDPDQIEVEPLEDLDLLEDALDADAVEEAEEVLEQLGPRGLERRLEKLERREERERRRIEEARATAERMAEEFERRRQDAHKASGARQAAAVERIALNGARSQVWEMSTRDRRVVGFVRRSLTGTPCGFCAMLIARGFVRKYLSRASAGGVSRRSRSVRRGSQFDADRVYVEGDKYHNNCKCIAEPVYSEAHYNTSPLFDLNREYAELWPQVTRGYSGRDALNAWRRFIRRRNAERTHYTSAQAAGADTNAQEA